MKFRAFVVLSLLLSLLAAGFGGTYEATAAGQFDRQIPSGGTTSFQAFPEGVDAGVQYPEFAGEPRDEGDTAGAGNAASNPSQIINRQLTKSKGDHQGDNGDNRPVKPAKLGTSFDGLNFRQQRLANGGNQFSVEPPDQGLCAGNGFILESVNDVLRVYDKAGNGQTGVIDLNTFYGYPAAIDRTTGVRGPFVTDPSCYYDQATQRWFQAVLTLDVNPATGAFLGSNHIDIAVTKTSSPLGGWVIYRLPVQDDGTQGTPDHGCSLNSDGTGHGPCIGDYPHIGADRNGFYVTTNEYSLNGPEFKSAQVYAFSKKALAANVATVGVSQFDTTGAVAGNPGFTVWPAISPDNQFENDANGAEYFLSSMAADEANGTHVDNRIAVWALTNTWSLNTPHPSLNLVNTIVRVKTYTVPPQSDQKAGDFPLGQCLNDVPCATFLLGGPDTSTEVESHLDSNDSRMQQVYFARGKLYGALDTGIKIGGQNKAGIAYYIFEPEVSRWGVHAETVKQGQFGLAGNNVTYPAVGVTSEGKAVIAFTLTGKDYYPSSAFVALDSERGVGKIQIAAAGKGPQDGFSGYKAFNDPVRPRWGDYGAAVADGKDIWVASEYIGQTCTLAQYTSTPFGSCGGTRATLGNWDTRISQITPSGNWGGDD